MAGGIQNLSSQGIRLKAGIPVPQQTGKRVGGANPAHTIDNGRIVLCALTVGSDNGLAVHTVRLAIMDVMYRYTGTVRFELRSPNNVTKYLKDSFHVCFVLLLL